MFGDEKKSPGYKINLSKMTNASYTKYIGTYTICVNLFKSILKTPLFLRH